MSFWLHKYIDDLDVMIDRYGHLKEIVENERKEEMEDLLKHLVNHKILLQKVVKNK